jgi:uncharacterized Zn finger protein
LLLTCLLEIRDTKVQIADLTEGLCLNLCIASCMGRFPRVFELVQLGLRRRLGVRSLTRLLWSRVYLGIQLKGQSQAPRQNQQEPIGKQS